MACSSTFIHSPAGEKEEDTYKDFAEACKVTRFQVTSDRLKKRLETKAMQFGFANLSAEVFPNLQCQWIVPY